MLIRYGTHNAKYAIRIDKKSLRNYDLDWTGDRHGK